MTWTQFWIYVASVLLSPLIALEVTVWINNRRAAKERKLAIFKALMRTRATGLAPDHVQALNMIDIEFYGTDENVTDVRRRWKAYLNHLNSDASPEIWLTQRVELLLDLLESMAKCLGYNFDRTDIRTTSYFPKGHGAMEDDLAAIRSGLVELIRNGRPLPVTLIPPPPSTPATNT
jgi:hypothetical protein